MCLYQHHGCHGASLVVDGGRADPRLERQALGNVRRAKEALRPSEAAVLLSRMPGGATSRDQDQRQCFPVPGAGVLRERKPPYANPMR